MNPTSPSDRPSRRGTLALGMLALSLLLVAAGGGALASLGSRPEAQARGAAEVNPLSRAKIAIGERDFGRAEALLRSIGQGSTQGTEARILLAATLLERGRVTEALGLAESVAKAVPGNFEALRVLAIAYEKAGRLELAVVTWERAAELRKDSAEGWRGLGLARREKGDQFGALSALDQSLKIDPAQEDLKSLVLELSVGKDLPGQAARAPRPPGAPFPGARAPGSTSPLLGPEIPDPSRHFPRPDGRIDR